MKKPQRVTSTAAWTHPFETRSGRRCVSWTIASPTARSHRHAGREYSDAAAFASSAPAVRGRPALRAARPRWPRPDGLGLRRPRDEGTARRCGVARMPRASVVGRPWRGVPGAGRRRCGACAAPRDPLSAAGASRLGGRVRLTRAHPAPWWSLPFRKGAGPGNENPGAREAGTRGGRTTRAAVEERTVEGGARRPVGHPELIDRLLVVAALAAIVLGGALHLAGRPGLGDATWAAGTIVVLVPLAWSVVRTLWRRRLGVNLIALVAMAAALAARRVPRRRRGRAHARGGQRARGGGGKAGRAGADGAGRARAPRRTSPGWRRARRGPGRGAGGRRRGRGPRGRGCAGGRRAVHRDRGRRRVGPHRGAPARERPGGWGGPQWDGQRRRRVRAARRAAGRRERLRRRRPARPRGAGPAGTVPADGRPLRRACCSR